MRLRAFLLALLFVLIVLPLPTHGDNGDCRGAPPIRLSSGSLARITFHGGEGAALYANPGEQFRRISILPDGTSFRVIGGPTCADAMQWWQVRSQDGRSGWLSEGDEAAYQLEPWAVALDVVQRSGNADLSVVRVKAGQIGAQTIAHFTVKPVTGTARDLFPIAEWQALEARLEAVQARCPALLRHEYRDLTSPADVPGGSGPLDAYPSPDSRQLLVVRHLWQHVPDCAGGPPSFYGVDRLSLVSADGETTLLEVPANARGPMYLDHFPYQNQSKANSRVQGVWWSPDGVRVLIWVRYADLRDAAAQVTTFKVMVYDLRTAMLTDLGDGLQPAWNATDNRVQWFRLIRSGQPPEEVLYSANPDGTDLRSIPLPAHIRFIMDSGQPILPWDDSGTRIAGCTHITPSGTPLCTSIAVFDVQERRVSPEINPAIGVEPDAYHAVKWIGDSALLWLPIGGAALYVQDITSGRITPIQLKSASGAPLALIDATPFADDQTVLVTLRDGTGRTSTRAVNIKTAMVTTLKMP